MPSTMSRGFVDILTTLEPVTSTDPGPDIDDVLKRTDNKASTDGLISTRLVHWIAGSFATLGLLLNIFVLCLIYKRKLLKKNYRLVYQMFMSIGAIGFAVSTATTSLSMAISDSKMNLLPKFGSCLMVQATALGSFHMIGISLALLTLDLLRFIKSPVRSMQSTKTSAAVIECLCCYFLGVIACYVPFFFWSDHPLEVETCSVSAIYGYHIDQANGFGIFCFVSMGLVLIILNGIVFKEIKGASWRTKLRRLSKDSSDTIPKDALRRSSRIKTGPSESGRRIEHSATIETTFIETNVLHESSLPGDGRFHEQKPETKVSEATSRDLSEDQVYQNTAFLEEEDQEPAEPPDILNTLDSFFVATPHITKKTFDDNNKTSKNRSCLILSPRFLRNARRMGVVPGTSNDAILPDSRRVSKTQQLLPKTGSKLHDDQSRIARAENLLSTDKEHESITKVETEKSADIQSNVSIESANKTRLQSSDLEVRKFLKTMRNEVIFSLCYIAFTVPPFVWNLLQIICGSACPLEDKSSHQIYYISMPILTALNPLMFVFASRQMRNAFGGILFRRDVYRD